MNDAAIRRFQELLQADLATLQQVKVLLQAERRSLETRDVESLERVTIEKTIALDAMDATAGARETLLEQLGVGRNAEALVEFFALPQVRAIAPEMESTWERLRQVLRDVRHENVVNGRVINRSRQTINTLLGVIRGQVNQRETYDQRGNRALSAPGCEIARA